MCSSKQLWYNLNYHVFSLFFFLFLLKMKNQMWLECFENLGDSLSYIFLKFQIFQLKHSLASPYKHDLIFIKISDNFYVDIVLVYITSVGLIPALISIWSTIIIDAQNFTKTAIIINFDPFCLCWPLIIK